MNDCKNKSETDTSIEYEVQQNPAGERWTSISYPSDMETAKMIYEDHRTDYPDIQFRIQEIKTVKSVVLISS